MVYNKKATDKLFDSIDSISVNPQQALEDFKKAVLEGADVNAFDDYGNTPLICVINTRTEYLNTKTEQLLALKEMFELLVQHKDIDINAQSKEPAYRKEQKTDNAGNRIFLHNGEEVIELVDDVTYKSKYVYAEDGKDVDYNDTNQFLNNLNQKYGTDQKAENVDFGTYYDAVYKEKQKLDPKGKPIPVGNTALHVAFMSGDEDAISALCRHQDIRSDIENHEGVKPEDIILKQITELKEKIRNDKSVHLTEKLALEKTIKDFEEQELRIKSKMEEIARNKGNPATVQNQEDKVVVAEQQRILDEIEEQKKKEDEFIQGLIRAKNEGTDFHNSEGQELTAIIRNKSASAKIIDVLFDQEILTTKITLALLKEIVSRDTDLLHLNNHFIETAVENIAKSKIHGKEEVSETMMSAIHSTLTLIRYNKSANLHIKDLKDNILYLERIVKSLEPLKGNNTISKGIEGFYVRKEEMLKNKTRDGTQALNVQHTQPLVGTSDGTFQGEGLNLGASPLPTQGVYQPSSPTIDSSDDGDKSPAGSSDPDYEGQYQSFPTIPPLDEDEDQSVPKTPTFWDKLSANKGKFTAGTIGASLLIAGIITALVVANPIVVASAIAAAVFGAIMLGGVALAKTTDKGEKMWDQAGQKLSSLLVSNREQRWL